MFTGNEAFMKQCWYKHFLITPLLKTQNKTRHCCRHPAPQESGYGGRSLLSFLKDGNPASWIPPFGRFPSTSHWEETPGQTQNLLEGLCNLSGLEMPWDPAGGAGEYCLREKSLSFSPGPVQPCNLSMDKC